VGEIANAQGAAAPACVTMALWPAIVMVPDRSLPPLPATANPTAPLPLPDRGGSRVIQPTSVVALQAHSADVVTLTLPSLAAEPTVWFGGDSSYRQGARCVTCTLLLLTTMSPSRPEPPSLAATRNWTSALPCPAAGENPEIQPAALDAVHAHSGCVATENPAVPPPASMADRLAANAT